MIRSVVVITFTVSLVLWSGQVFCDALQEIPEEMLAIEDVSCYPAMNCYPQGQPCPTAGHRHGVGQLCPIVGHRHLIGQPCPIMGHGQGLGYRLGTGGAGTGSAQPMPGYVQQPGQAQPMSAGPPPNRFLGSALMPRQYPQTQQTQMPVGGYAQDYSSFPPEQRIVYIPYAMPPPIYVERLGKALPRPPIMRQILGDAYMYEYPEMPLRLYTTRGPRDFLAPNPPSIGE